MCVLKLALNQLPSLFLLTTRLNNGESFYFFISFSLSLACLRSLLSLCSGNNDDHKVFQLLWFPVCRWDIEMQACLVNSLWKIFSWMNYENWRAWIETCIVCAVEHLVDVVVPARIYLYLYVIPVNCLCRQQEHHKMPQEWEARLRNYDSLPAIMKRRVNSYSSKQRSFSNKFDIFRTFSWTCRGNTCVLSHFIMEYYKTWLYCWLLSFNMTNYYRLTLNLNGIAQKYDFVLVWSNSHPNVTQSCHFKKPFS